MFPGYLFCRLNLAKHLLSVVTTYGVLGIAGAGKHPIAISDREIESLQAMVRSGLPLVSWPGLSAGSAVLIEHGPLTGLEGIVLHADKKYQLVVSVSLLQRSVAVELQRDWVRPLTPTGKVPASVQPLHNPLHSPQLACERGMGMVKL